jgi:hypothetical protein
VASTAALTKQALFSATTESSPSRYVAVISPLIRCTGRNREKIPIYLGRDPRRRPNPRKTK